MNEKQIAGESSVEFIEDGMIIGLGTGSTVNYMVKKLAKKIKDGLKITCVSTSVQTSNLAKELGIDVRPFNEIENVDLTIDGADEVDSQLNGIKGGGGALLMEKIVAKYSKKVIWIVDSKKPVTELGKFPLPVEVVRFGSEKLFKEFEEFGFNPKFRTQGQNLFITDSGNYIIDLYMNKIEDPISFEKDLKMICGVIETGLFNNIADILIIGREAEPEILYRKM